MKIILLGGSGQNGGAVTRELLESGFCTHLTLVTRRHLDAFDGRPSVTQVVLNTASAAFEQAVSEAAAGHDAAICCVGIGSGTLMMSVEQIMEVEVRLVGRFARGCRKAGIDVLCALTAVGSSTSQAASRLPQVRAIGLKHQTLVEAGFGKLAIFQPGMIVGNAHTPRWLTPFTRFIPDALGWGNIHINVLAKAFVAHLQTEARTQSAPVVCYGNREMKRLAGRPDLA
jgi:uncharacterized protein YbjT (DUF2867 family)